MGIGEIIFLILFPTTFISFIIWTLYDSYKPSGSWEYRDDGYKYDTIYGGRKKMNKRERIEQLELEVKRLEKELEYVEHKNDKAEIKKHFDFMGCANFTLIYTNHKTRSIESLRLGAYLPDWNRKCDYDIKILRETSKEIYIKVPTCQLKEFDIIKVVNKEDDTIKEVFKKDFETLKELFETKPKKSNKKEK